MATHSSVLAWRIPGTGEPGGLPSMGSHRVGHDWSDLAVAAVRKQETSTHCWGSTPLRLGCILQYTERAGIEIAGRNINNLRYADDTTLMAESKEELKSLLMKVKEESEKSDLKLNTEKTKIMASGPSLHDQKMGKQWKQWDFIFLGFRITVDGDCSHEIKRCLLLGRKAMTNLDNIWKSRDITFSKVIHLVRAMVLSVVMYGCESWTIKKAEHQRIDASELWCWRRLLRDWKDIKLVNPKGNQPWIFIGRTDAEAEAPVLWPLDTKHWLIRKDPDAGKDWRQ